MLFFSRDSDEGSVADLGAVGAWRDSAADSFESVFEALGWPTALLRHPELYPDPRFLPIIDADGAARVPPFHAWRPAKAGVEGGPITTLSPRQRIDGRPPVHVSFRALHRMNLVKGAFNICAFPWRRPTLPDSFAPGANIRRNAKHMLSLVDQIWCSSDAAAQTLKACGLSHAVANPAPIVIPPPARDALEKVDGLLARTEIHRPVTATRRRLSQLLNTSAGETKPALFVSVVDPDDPFNGLEAAVQGFALAARRAQTNDRPRAVLAVALALDPDRRARRRPVDWIDTLVRERFEQRSELATTDILFVVRRLSPTELIGLFDAADFYLSTATASDQNQAMQTAMARGAIPVAVRSGEARDYLDDNQSIAIPSQPTTIRGDAGGNESARFDQDGDGVANGDVFEVEAASPRDVATACSAAIALSADRRSALSQSAAALASARFSVRAAAARTKALIDAAVVNPSPAADDQSPPRAKTVLR